MGIKDTIQEHLNEVDTLKTDTFGAIDNALETLDQSALLEAEIPEQNGRTINGIQARLSAMLSLVEPITNDDLDLQLVPHDHLLSLSKSIKAIGAALSDIIVNMTQIEQQGGYGSIDNNNFVISNINKGKNYALGQRLTTLDTNIDAALIRFYSISPAISRPDFIGLSTFTKDIEKTYNETKKAKTNAKRDATQIKNLEQKMNSINEKIKAIQNQISETEQQIEKSKSNANQASEEIKSHLNEINSLQPQIEQTDKSARELKTKIEQHHDDLDLFVSEMEKRIQLAQKGREDLTKLGKDFEIHQEEYLGYTKNAKQKIEDIINRAEEMLGLSTSAGLGETFKQQADARKSAIMFNYIMMIISFVIVAGVGAWAAHALIISENAINWANFATKIAIIVPFAVLASISVKSMRTLEKSKEHYEHKRAVSNALEGYRKLFEDPADQKQLLNNTVTEILKDPSDGLKYPEGEDASVLGILDRFADVFVKITNTKKK